MKSDSQIWENFKKGEDFALSHIYYQNIQFLFRYGKKFTKNEELIKDTIQDIFFDLIRTREKLGETDNIKFYLITSFRRKLFNNINKQNPFKEGNFNYTPEADIVYSAEYELIGREELSHRKKVIQQGLAKLSSKQREILYYRFLCEFEYDQICEIMSIKYDSARKQVFRALKVLKLNLKEGNMLLLFTSFFSKKKTIVKV